MAYSGSSTRKKWENILSKLVVVEIIICYMTVLTIFSYVRGPEKYQRDPSEPGWTASDFSCSDEAGPSGVQGDMLHMENTTPGHNVVFQTSVMLAETDGFYISFLIDCPQEYQGSHLAVDIFNEAAGYDEGSMEYMHTFSEGENKIICELFPEENAPDSAVLRIFTADTANYDVRQLKIYPLLKTEKVSAGMVFFLIFAVTVTVITGAAYWKLRKD